MSVGRTPGFFSLLPGVFSPSNTVLKSYKQQRQADVLISGYILIHKPIILIHVTCLPCQRLPQPLITKKVNAIFHWSFNHSWCHGGPGVSWLRFQENSHTLGYDQQLIPNISIQPERPGLHDSESRMDAHTGLWFGASTVSTTCTKTSEY